MKKNWFTGFLPSNAEVKCQCAPVPLDEVMGILYHVCYPSFTMASVKLAKDEQRAAALTSFISIISAPRPFDQNKHKQIDKAHSWHDGRQVLCSPDSSLCMKISFFFSFLLTPLKFSSSPLYMRRRKGEPIFLLSGLWTDSD